MLATVTPALNLIVRTQVGEDDWGKPLMEEVPVAVKGYVYQMGANDPDRSGTVAVESSKAIVFPLAGDVPIKEWMALELVLFPTSEVRRWEIVGAPEPKFSLVNGKLHHWEMLVSEASA